MPTELRSGCSSWRPGTDIHIDMSCAGGVHCPDPLAASWRVHGIKAGEDRQQPQTSFPFRHPTGAAPDSHHSIIASRSREEVLDTTTLLITSLHFATSLHSACISFTYLPACLTSAKPRLRAANDKLSPTVHPIASHARACFHGPRYQGFTKITRRHWSAQAQSLRHWL